MAQPKWEEQLFTEKEYLALEEASDTRHEFWFGRIIAMAGAKDSHVSLASQASRALNNRLDDTPCQAGTGDLRIRLNDKNYAYPDVVVWCDDAKWDDQSHVTLLNPRVLIEVLSASTGARDRGIKLESYTRIPELLDYLIVSQNRVFIEHYRRVDSETWQRKTYNRRDQNVHFAFENLEIPVSEIYRRVDVPEQLVLWDEDEG